jgi:hypothetical protein
MPWRCIAATIVCTHLAARNWYDHNRFAPPRKGGGGSSVAHSRGISWHSPAAMGRSRSAPGIWHIFLELTIMPSSDDGRGPARSARHGISQNLRDDPRMHLSSRDSCSGGPKDVRMRDPSPASRLHPSFTPPRHPAGLGLHRRNETDHPCSPRGIPTPAECTPRVNPTFKSRPSGDAAIPRANPRMRACGTRDGSLRRHGRRAPASACGSRAGSSFPRNEPRTLWVTPGRRISTGRTRPDLRVPSPCTLFLPTTEQTREIVQIQWPPDSEPSAFTRACGTRAPSHPVMAGLDPAIQDRRRGTMGGRLGGRP